MPDDVNNGEENNNTCHPQKSDITLVAEAIVHGVREVRRVQADEGYVKYAPNPRLVSAVKTGGSVLNVQYGSDAAVRIFFLFKRLRDILHLKGGVDGQHDVIKTSLKPGRNAVKMCFL